MTCGLDDFIWQTGDNHLRDRRAQCQGVVLQIRSFLILIVSAHGEQGSAPRVRAARRAIPAYERGSWKRRDRGEGMGLGGRMFEDRMMQGGEYNRPDPG